MTGIDVQQYLRQGQAGEPQKESTNAESSLSDLEEGSQSEEEQDQTSHEDENEESQSSDAQ